MIGIDYDISRIDNISVQFEDDATVSFSLSGKLRSRSPNLTKTPQHSLSLPKNISERRCLRRYWNG
jgi:hypothetical protein